jgi:hypothetical protein
VANCYVAKCYVASCVVANCVVASCYVANCMGNVRCMYRYVFPLDRGQLLVQFLFTSEIFIEYHENVNHHSRPPLI